VLQFILICLRRRVMNHVTERVESARVVYAQQQQIRGEQRQKGQGEMDEEGEEGDWAAQGMQSNHDNRCHASSEHPLFSC
jgi:hypothetical protein